MKKILFVFLAIISLVGTSYAFEIRLSVNKKYIDINKPLKLKLTIKNDQNKPIKIEEIKGLDNFDIIGQSQSQTMSTQIVNINGQQKVKTITNINLFLTLQAQKTGYYTLGPAIVKVGDKIYKSNSVNIRITGAKIMIGNSNYNLPTNSQNQNIQQNSQQIPTNNLDTIDSKNNEITNNKENKTNPLTYILILLVLIGIGIIVYLLKFNKNNKEQVKTQNTENIIKEKNNKKSLNHKLAFLSNYGIENFETKTYSEIMREIKEKGINLSPNELEIIKSELLDSFRK